MCNVDHFILTQTLDWQAIDRYPLAVNQTFTGNWIIFSLTGWTIQVRQEISVNEAHFQQQIMHLIDCPEMHTPKAFFLYCLCTAEGREQSQRDQAGFDQPQNTRVYVL